MSVKKFAMAWASFDTTNRGLLMRPTMEWRGDVIFLYFVVYSVLIFLFYTAHTIQIAIHSESQTSYLPNACPPTALHTDH